MAQCGFALALGVLGICGNLGENEILIPAAAAQGAVTTPVRIAYGSDRCKLAICAFPPG